MNERITARIAELEAELQQLAGEAAERQRRMKVLVDEHNAAMTALNTRAMQVEGAIRELSALLPEAGHSPAAPESSPKDSEE